MNLPKDPYILLSYINTKLRNEFNSLEDLCLSIQVDEDHLIASLSSIGYTYDQNKNQFVSLE